MTYAYISMFGNRLKNWQTINTFSITALKIEEDQIQKIKNEVFELKRCINVPVEDTNCTDPCNYTCQETFNYYSEKYALADPLTEFNKTRMNANNLMNAIFDPRKFSLYCAATSDKVFSFSQGVINSNENMKNTEMMVNCFREVIKALTRTLVYKYSEENKPKKPNNGEKLKLCVHFSETAENLFGASEEGYECFVTQITTIFNDFLKTSLKIKFAGPGAESAANDLTSLISPADYFESEIKFFTRFDEEEIFYVLGIAADKCEQKVWDKHVEITEKRFIDMVTNISLKDTSPNFWAYLRHNISENTILFNALDLQNKALIALINSKNGFFTAPTQLIECFTKNVRNPQKLRSTSLHLLARGCVVWND